VKDAIEQKLFREDLYYRLNVVPIHLPALRHHPEDIIPLAQYFLEKICEENKIPCKVLSIESQHKLLAYHWPGNIRELANLIERTIVMHAESILIPDHFNLEIPSQQQSPPPAMPLAIGMTLEEMEKQLILQTLTAHHNNRTKTAQVLGISSRTLRNKLHQYQKYQKQHG